MPKKECKIVVYNEPECYAGAWVKSGSSSGL